MATTRRSSIHNVGKRPPFITWTFVKGDTASFKAYVTDDNKQPLNLSDWSISMKVKRPNATLDLGVISDDAQFLLNTTPSPEIGELPGYFTTSLTSEQTQTLRTGDIFDIQLSQIGLVWTVVQGSMVVLEDVTD